MVKCWGYQTHGLSHTSTALATPQIAPGFWFDFGILRQDVSWDVDQAGFELTAWVLRLKAFTTMPSLYSFLALYSRVCAMWMPCVLEPVEYLLVGFLEMVSGGSCWFQTLYHKAIYDPEFFIFKSFWTYTHALGGKECQLSWRWCERWLWYEVFCKINCSWDPRCVVAPRGGKSSVTCVCLEANSGWYFSEAIYLGWWDQVTYWPGICRVGYAGQWATERPCLPLQCWDYAVCHHNVPSSF